METIRCGDSWSVNRLAVARSGYGVNDRFVDRAEIPLPIILLVALFMHH
jgi:hypothetical protein